MSGNSQAKEIADLKARIKKLEEDLQKEKTISADLREELKKSKANA